MFLNSRDTGDKLGVYGAFDGAAVKTAVCAEATVSLLLTFS